MTSWTPDLSHRDGPRDECGVFGIYAPELDVSRHAYFALYALQHRGQESAGIAASDAGGYIITQRALGLVSQVFKEHDLKALSGDLAITGAEVAINAGVAALGIVVASLPSVAQEIGVGKLVPLLAAWDGGEISAHALFPS